MERPEYSVNSLCGLFGVSRQAYYQHKDISFEVGQLKTCLVEYILEVRRNAPRMGGNKLFKLCEKSFKESFPFGRDAFYDFLRENHLMLRRRHRHTRTTNSHHQFHTYSNLTKGFVPTAPNQLWVSDITYIALRDRFCFLSLVTDAYSHRIMGWKLAPTLAFSYTEEAMRIAINVAHCDLHGLIHHSDRGFQYAYPHYITLLNDHGILPSMTENGDPLENAIAERTNGILKQEWLNDYQFKTIDEVCSVLEKIIPFYNTQRPHSSIDWLTPEEAYRMSGLLKKHWKNYYGKKLDPIQTNEYVAASIKIDSESGPFSMCQPFSGVRPKAVNPI